MYALHRSDSIDREVANSAKEDKGNVENRILQIEHALAEVLEVGDDRKVI